MAVNVNEIEVGDDVVLTSAAGLVEVIWIKKNLKNRNHTDLGYIELSTKSQCQVTVDHFCNGIGCSPSIQSHVEKNRGYSGKLSGLMAHLRRG